MLSRLDSGGVHQVRDLPRELLDLRIELALAGRSPVRRAPILRQARRSRRAARGCQRKRRPGVPRDRIVPGRRWPKERRNTGRYSERMRKASLAAAVLLALGVGAYVGVVRPALAPSKDVELGERALLTPDVVVVAHANIRQAVFLERWFIGSPILPPEN